MNKEISKSNIVYEGNFVNVRIDTVQHGDATIQREIVEEKGDGVVIAPVTHDNKLILIRQKRHLYGSIYELPAGGMKDGEDPLVAAKRELLEETGIVAKTWELMSSHVNSVHMTGTNYYYLARNLTYGEKTDFDGDEVIGAPKAFRFAEVEDFIANNKVPDIRNRGCIWLAKLRLIENGLSLKDE